MIDASGAGQTLGASVRAGEEQVFVVRVANDGNVPNRVHIRAVGRGTAARVQYLRGGRDRTRRLVDGRPLQLRLDPGAYRQVRVVVTVARDAEPGDTVRALLRAVWRGDETRVDAVGARVRVRR